MQKGDKVESKHNYIVIAIITGAIVIAFWLINYCVMVDSKSTDLFGERGTFGDMFGAVNALFSGLAFAGLIVTLIMQHEELKNQRKEIEQQNITLKIQRFENTLFNMLSMQQRIVEGLNYSVTDSSAKESSRAEGILVFKYFYECLDLSKDKDFVQGIKLLLKDQDPKCYYAYYCKVKNISVLDSYFRHLYRIFKYIDESPLIEDREGIKNSERYEYTCIVRAQLSDYELLMLFYNALANDDNGELKFMRLIEKYAIFNNLRKDMLANETDAELYGKSAYEHTSVEDVSDENA